MFSHRWRSGGQWLQRLYQWLNNARLCASYWSFPRGYYSLKLHICVLGRKKVGKGVSVTLVPFLSWKLNFPSLPSPAARRFLLMVHPPELRHRGTPSCRPGKKCFQSSRLWNGRWQRKRIGEGTVAQQCLPHQCFPLPGRDHLLQTPWPAASYSLIGCARAVGCTFPPGLKYGMRRQRGALLWSVMSLKYGVILDLWISIHL